MLLIAQRVVSGQGQQGLNAFCYLHGAYTWVGEAPPEIAAHLGELVNSHVEVTGHGNSVRSYLDILAPDTVPSQRIYADVTDAAQFIAESRPPPWRMSSGDTTFTFDVELALAAGWQSELATLLSHALAVRAPH